MKKASLFIVALVVLVGITDLHAQSDEPEPEALSGISVFASTLLVASPVNFSYDRLYPVGNIHMGYTTGLTFLFLSGGLFDTNTLFGGHLTYTMLAGPGRVQFEMKLGLSYTPFVLASQNSFNTPDFKFIPVVSAGIRKKASTGKGFFRFALSTAGVGIGFGSLL